MSELDDKGQVATIPQLPPTESHQTPGVCLAPDGNNEDKFNYLLEVAKSWQTLMSVAKVTHAAAEFGLCQVIL